MSNSEINNISQKERDALYRKKWRQNNKEKVLAQKERYRRKHKDTLREKGNKYSKSILVKMQNTVTRGDRACEEIGSLTSIELMDLLVGQDGKCNCCGKKISHEMNNINLDHFIPTSRGGSNTLENVQWVCSSCNQYKMDEIPKHKLTFVLWRNT
jgi:5-methylcytosine-specific restriction endonuclease McrA